MTDLEKPHDRPAPAKSKVETVVQFCVHEIGTGAWPPGHRLPSLRDAERLWSVNHLTVLKAYRRLAAVGFVRSEPRAGFFVVDQLPMRDPREDLDRLAEILDDLDRRHADRGPATLLGLSRSLAALAESRARQTPEVAFVECTRAQAGGHAAEIRRRLDLPCTAWTVGEIDAGPRVLLTTSFHQAEVRRAARRLGLATLTVPIEFAPIAAARLPRTIREVVCYTVDPDLAKRVARDAVPKLPRRELRVRSRSSSPAAIERTLSRTPNRSDCVTLLSSSLWSAVSDRWRDHPRVLPIRYRIIESAWPTLAAALGMPFSAHI